MYISLSNRNQTDIFLCKSLKRRRFFFLQKENPAHNTPTPNPFSLSRTQQKTLIFSSNTKNSHHPSLPSLSVALSVRALSVAAPRRG
ncbi:hypothetical protein HN873_053456 [Arachis hypogaea]